MQNAGFANKHAAQAAAAAKIMAEVKKTADKDPNKEEIDRKWNENRNMNFRQRKARDELEQMEQALSRGESFLCPFVFDGDFAHFMLVFSFKHKWA